MHAIIPTGIVEKISKGGKKYFSVTCQNGDKLNCWKPELAKGLKLGQENQVSVMENNGFKNIEAVEGIQEFSRPAGNNGVKPAGSGYVDNRKNYDFTRDEKIKFSEEDRGRYVKYSAFNAAISYVKSFVDKGLVPTPESGYEAVKGAMDKFEELLESRINEKTPD